MRSQDGIPENSAARDNFEVEDMWSLIEPQPRADGFRALLSGNGGKEVKESFAKPSWDSAPAKAYASVAVSRSSLSSDSLQLCTEGLGCESCDGLTDSASDESSSAASFDDYSSEEEEEEDLEWEEKLFPAALPARSFPPPLPSLCASSASYMRSVKKDGRFVLQSVKMPAQNYLHSFREGGRLKMLLVARADDDFVLPQASTLIKPEKEILFEEVDGGGGKSDSDEIKGCFKFPAPEVAKISDAVSISGEKSKACEVQNLNAAAEFKGAGCKLKDRNKSSAAKSVEDHEICDMNPFPKTSSACFNVYSGWRTELAEQNSSIFCCNWQKAQSLPLNKGKYAEANNVDVNMNVNESCVHARVTKLRLNDLSLGRCHAHRSLSVWGKSQCIATNS